MRDFDYFLFREFSGQRQENEKSWLQWTPLCHQGIIVILWNHEGGYYKKLHKYVTGARQNNNLRFLLSQQQFFTFFLFSSVFLCMLLSS